MNTGRLLRRSAGLLWFGGIAALFVPLATGHFDPPWLRVAEFPIPDRDDRPPMELPQLDAPIRAEQRDLQGHPLWTLAAQSVRSRSPTAHSLDTPHLIAYRDGLPLLDLAARHGDVTLPDNDTDPFRLELTGDVTLQHPNATLHTQRLYLEGLRANDPQATVRTGRLRTHSPVALTLLTPDGTPQWTAHAAGLEATGDPFLIHLLGPVTLHSTPLPNTHSLPNHTLHLEASSARLQPAPHTHDTFPPDVLHLDLHDVRAHALDPQGQPAANARADHVRLIAQRQPTTARAALGGAAGLSPTPTLHLGDLGYAPQRLQLRGTVDATRLLPNTTRLQAQTLDLDLRADRLIASGNPTRLHGPHEELLESSKLWATRHNDRYLLDSNSPTTLQLPHPTDPTTPPWTIRVDTLHATLRAQHTRWTKDLSLIEHLELTNLLAHRLDHSSSLHAPLLLLDTTPHTARWNAPQGLHARLAPDLTGEDTRADPAPWSFDCDTLSAQTSTAPWTSNPTSLWHALQHTEHVRIRRLDARRNSTSDHDPRHLAIQALRLDGDPKHDAWTFSGDVALEVGPHRASADWLQARPTPDPTILVDARGHLRASIAVVESGQRTRTLWIQADRATATLDPDPAAWDAAKERRSYWRDRGSPGVLPRPIRALTVEAAAGRQIRASGPDGLAIWAQRAELDDHPLGGRRLRLRGQPVTLRTQGGEVQAPRLEAWRHEQTPWPRTFVRWTGGVTARASALHQDARWRAEAPWVAAAIWDPQRDSTASVGSRTGGPLGRFVAGGGVDLWGEPATDGDPPWRITAEQLEGNGRTRRVEAWGSNGVNVRRGEDTLQAGRVRAWGLGGGVVRLEVRETFVARGSLPGDAKTTGIDGEALGAELALGEDVSGRGEVEAFRGVVRRLWLRGPLVWSQPDLQVEADRGRWDPGTSSFRLEGDPLRVRGRVRGEYSEWQIRLQRGGR